jgi:hypothetical protein
MDSTANPTIVYLADKIGNGLAALAASLKVPAEHVYELLVRQQIVTAWRDIITSTSILVFLLIAGAVVLLTTKGRPWFKDGRMDVPTARFGVRLALCVLIAISFVTVLVTVPNAVVQLLNPEYYAIRDIAAMLSGNTGGCR